jgi:hypothetical protein
MANNIWAIPLAVTDFNVIVAFLGGFISLFGLVSYLLKENYYMSEAREFLSLCPHLVLLSSLFFFPLLFTFVFQLYVDGAAAPGRGFVSAGLAEYPRQPCMTMWDHS